MRSRLPRVLAVWMVVFFCLVMTAAAAQPAGPAPAGERTGTRAELQVDLNRAGESELIKVPGIGPALAKRIIEFRESHGPFRRVEDLLKIRGIGEKSFQKLKPYLTVSEPR